MLGIYTQSGEGYEDFEGKKRTPPFEGHIYTFINRNGTLIAH